jgi:hypothetical protein
MNPEQTLTESRTLLILLIPTECQALYPVVRIGSSHPLTLTRKGVLLPPLGVHGGDTLACGGVSRGANSEEGTDTLVRYSMYSIIPLRRVYVDTLPYTLCCQLLDIWRDYPIRQMFF